LFGTGLEKRFKSKRLTAQHETAEGEAQEEKVIAGEDTYVLRLPLARPEDIHDVVQVFQAQEEAQERETGHNRRIEGERMGIVLTEEEKQLVKEGKLDPSAIEEHRKTHPVKSVDLNAVDAVKQQIREANAAYQEAIARNKQLYTELQENRKKKEECRNRLMELRKKKKELLGK
jgi:hypothetical protein